MPDETAIIENQKYSIREFSPGVYGGLVGDGIGLLWPGRHDLIGAWGTWQCDRDLRWMFYLLHNTLTQGAFGLFIQNILSTPYEISGGRNLTYQWQDIFFEADFGEGYDFMLSKALLDYLTLNRGCFIEKVSYGDPSTPLQDGARILALNHLDAMRIVFTGNRELPYRYYSEYTGKLHDLHASRVIHLVDMPTPNTRLHGIGMSALYRAFTVSNAQILLGRHQTELLNDQPPPGLVVFNNVKGENVEQVMRLFEADRNHEGQSVYRGVMRLEGSNPNEPVSVTFVPLASVPEDFSYEKYLQQHVNLLALALQVDPQDIWPLTNTPLGTGMQARILERKAQSKGYGYLLTRLEREWNTVTPRPLEFKYKAQNAEAGKEEAEIAQLWTSTVNGMSDLTQLERRQILANQVVAVADVLLDTDGNIRLPDDDPKVPGQETIDVTEDEDTTADDTEQVGAAAQVEPGEEVTADDTEQVEKDYDATAASYEADVAAVIADGQAKAISKASFSARMRSLNNRYGKQVYLDGLEDGGVITDTLDADDREAVALLLSEGSGYVTNLANEVYSESGLKGTPEQRATYWTKKTLDQFYYAGLESADKNGMYEFDGPDGKESCNTCKRLKFQVHRLKDWRRKQLRPQVDTANFICGGWNCEHDLYRREGVSAKGSW